GGCEGVREEPFVDLRDERETDLITRGGARLIIRWSTVVLPGPDGRPRGTVSIGMDLTEVRRAEAQLHQANKMDAIGRLASGIVHDFNNLLSVVLSYSRMVLSDLPGDHPVRDDVSEIHRAGERAAALTRQLLAFSRQQIAQPRVIDLNEVVAGMERMLRRVVGDRVELELQLASPLAAIKADPSLLEQVLLNLVVNARDAMPEGGR